MEKTLKKTMPRLAKRLLPEDDVVKSNEGLIRSIVTKMRIHPNNYDAALQTGRIGMLYALRKFDPQKGAAFSTFASHCIRGYILHFLRNECGSILHGTTREKESRRIPHTTSLDEAFDDDGCDGSCGAPYTLDDKTLSHVSVDLKRATRGQPDLLAILEATMEGYTLRDIAPTIGISAVAVGRKLNRWRPFLRHELRDYEPCGAVAAASQSRPPRGGSSRRRLKP